MSREKVRVECCSCEVISGDDASCPLHPGRVTFEAKAVSAVRPTLLGSRGPAGVRIELIADVPLMESMVYMLWHKLGDKRFADLIAREEYQLVKKAGA